MTKIDLIESFIRLEGQIKKECEESQNIGEQIIYESFIKVIHSLHEIIRKLSKTECEEKNE